MMMTKNMILSIFLWITCFTASAAPFTGNLHLYQYSNYDIVPPTPISGDIDIASGFMSVQPIMFFGQYVTTHSVEFLPEGSHTRYVYGVPTTATIQPGQIGAWLNISFAANDVSTFMVWNVSQVGDTLVFTPADSDGDGTLGQTYLYGPFGGISAIFSFTAETEGPGISLDLTVIDGYIQECNQKGGNQVEASVSVMLFDGAELLSLEWRLDGEVIGTGDNIIHFMPLGSHTLTVTAYGANDITATASAPVDIVDRTPPTLFSGFIDADSGAVITQIDSRSMNKVIAKYEATDICDASPVVDGIGGFKIESGETIKVKKHQGKVVLPTSELTLHATARDSSGNYTVKYSTLNIIE